MNQSYLIIVHPPEAHIAEFGLILFLGLCLMAIGFLLGWAYASLKAPDLAS